MKNQPKIFVVIVTYKGQRWYDKCFTSLRESTIPLQTVVVDNTPGEEDAEYIKTHFPEVHLIKTNENLGFGRANNLGMRYALDNGCDYVFLLNQDAWIEPNTIEKLISIAEKNPEYGILSPIHMNASKDQINMMYYDDNHNSDLVSDLYCGHHKDLYPVRYVNAAAWLMPRKTLETVGGFCPLIYMYGEDDDYLNRMKYHRMGVCICSDARIVHDTAIKLEESKQNSRIANEVPLTQYLDITKKIVLPNVRKHHLWKYLLNSIRRNKAKRDYYKTQYDYLKEHMEGIIACRTQHMQKQANWL